ncbi:MULTISPECIES: hypothetical protein [unclassified Microcoleus]|uniref:hypothetical protein n=1 Tax=unclassified Microcoleus TaxID=2642155 RepID=UPI002FCF5E9B
MCGSKKPVELIPITANRRLHPDLVKTVFFRSARKQKWEAVAAGDRNCELFVTKDSTITKVKISRKHIY